MTNYRLIVVEYWESVVVSRLLKKICLNEDAEELSSELNDVLNRTMDDEQRSKLLVDFSQVIYISHDCWFVLIRLNKSANKQGVGLYLCEICPNLKDILKIGGLGGEFRIKDTVAEAFVATD